MILSDEYKRQMGYMNDNGPEKKSKSDKPKKSDSDVQLDSVDKNKVIAYVSKGGFKLIGASYVLVKEGISSKPVLYNSGLRLSAPWVKNTIIFSSFLTIHLEKRQLNTLDNIEIMVEPEIQFKITDYEKFYRTFCSKKGVKMITTSEEDIGLVYPKLRNVISEIVSNCEFEYVKKFMYSKGNFNISNSVLETKISDIFADIAADYGIIITQFSVPDADLPADFQKRANELAQQDAENKAKEKAAKTEAEITKINAGAEAEKAMKMLEVETETLKRKAELEALKKQLVGTSEAERLSAIGRSLESLPDDLKARIMNTMSMPEGTININGGNSQTDLLTALLVHDKIEQKNNDSVVSSDENTNSKTK